MTAVYVKKRSAPGGNAHGRKKCQGSTGEGAQPRPLTPLQKINLAMSQDERTIRELAVGRRLGLYKVRGEIGSGSFSSVRLGIHALTTDKVAIKVLDKSLLDQETQRLLSQEIESMERLHHPNVIRLYEVVETPSRLHLVMEYAEGGELYTKISTVGKLPDTDSKIVFSQILAAVKHMHENNIIHRDLKAENVFYTCSGCVKRLIRGILQPQPTHRYTAEQMTGCEWLLPVRFPQPVKPFRLDPLRLVEAEPGELDEEEEEVRGALEALGITAEHMRNNRNKNPAQQRHRSLPDPAAPRPQAQRGPAHYHAPHRRPQK
ncbi:hypothetical protein SKAU_G00286590 [Synaphobranchus kaupii]|uniref:non-specific serine/threonine protein kinase n=1 Tax=Synaphobranchus kaupii TaxID=118154 RepID=A0A9Q1IPI9_SYNKA|nr:hypothetical protein SKAU_G00286590 [Synaphobranchus kaupii]